MLEQALRTYLLTITAITDIVGDRIHVGMKLFASLDDLPAITIEATHQGGKVARPSHLETLNGTPVDLQFPEYDIVCHGPLWEDSIPLADLVRRAFQAIANGSTITITVPGGTANVVIDEIEPTGNAWNEPEDHIGHGNTDKPRAQHYRIGWRENVAAL